jgi:hypothetical protein
MKEVLGNHLADFDLVNDGFDQKDSIKEIVTCYLSTIGISDAKVLSTFASEVALVTTKLNLDDDAVGSEMDFIKAIMLILDKKIAYAFDVEISDSLAMLRIRAAALLNLQVFDWLISGNQLPIANYEQGKIMILPFPAPLESKLMMPEQSITFIFN